MAQIVGPIPTAAEFARPWGMSAVQAASAERAPVREPPANAIRSLKQPFLSKLDARRRELLDRCIAQIGDDLAAAAERDRSEGPVTAAPDRPVLAALRRELVALHAIAHGLRPPDADRLAAHRQGAANAAAEERAARADEFRALMDEAKAMESGPLPLALLNARVRLDQLLRWLAALLPDGQGSSLQDVAAYWVDELPRQLPGMTVVAARDLVHVVGRERGLTMPSHEAMAEARKTRRRSASTLEVADGVKGRNRKTTKRKAARPKAAKSKPRPRSNR